MKNKTLLKALSTLLAVVMVLCSAPLSGFTGINLPDLFSLKAEAEEYTEGNFYYRIDYYLDENDVKQYYSSVTGCVVPDEDIVIPETLGGYSVTTIGGSAFEDCTNLISITIPDSVTIIDDFVFSGCSNLKSIKISDNVTSIGYYAFYDCVSLTSVIIPKGVEEIKDGSFDGCINLSSITLQNENLFIKTNVFSDTAYYDDLKNWENGALYIGNNLIAAKETVNNCVIKEGTEFISEEAFFQCNNLESITIPQTIKEVGKYAFLGCSSLKDVYYQGTIDSWTKILFNCYWDGDYYSSNPLTHAEHFYINGVLVKDLFIEKSNELSSNGSFCNSLCIDTILVKDVYQLGSRTFEGGNFSEVHLDNIKMIANAAFSDCKNLKTVILENIVVISSSMFGGCENLKEIYVSKDVKIIEDYAFSNCENIETVYYEGTEEEWNAIAVYPENIDLFEANVVFLNNTGIKPNFAGKNEVSIEDMTIDYKETVRISENFKVNTDNKYKLTYKSSDESIVTVDENGYVTGVGRGSAEITVTLSDAYGNEVSDTCVVTVNTTWWQWLIIIFLFGWIWY